MFFCAGDIKAHSLNITVTELHVLIGSTKINAHIYVHPFLIGMFLKRYNYSYDTTVDSYDYKKEIAEYLSSRLAYEDNNDLCRISPFNFSPMDEFKIIVGGMEIDYPS